MPDRANVHFAGHFSPVARRVVADVFSADFAPRVTGRQRQGQRATLRAT